MAKKTTRRTATKKKVAKKTARKTTKKTARAAAPAAKKPRIDAVDKPRTKSQVITTISEQTELSRKQVQAVFDAMAEVMAKDLSKRGPGVFNVPGLMKVKRISKKATPARKGINPFTGEPTVFKAKPARSVVKVQPLKGLKELV
ncbi:MAG: HU family DNA-binding protein [Phycisphaerales bacterium]|nr:HU family DNA-binding protein [Phycisphaerales bacterium]